MATSGGCLIYFRFTCILCDINCLVCTLKTTINTELIIKYFDTQENGYWIDALFVREYWKYQTRFRNLLAKLVFYIYGLSLSVMLPVPKLPGLKNVVNM